MPKKFMLFVAAVTLALLAGCVTPLATGKVDPAMPAAQLEVQKLVNEANVLLAAIYQTAADNKTQGLWTDKQKNDCIAEADDYARQVDSTKDFIKSGNFDAAKVRVVATQALVKALLRRAAAAKAGAFLDIEPYVMGA